MALLQYTSKEKLAIACKRWQELMSYLMPADTPIAGWVDAIAQEHGMGINGDEIFENVYRCYHSSYKVVFMQLNPTYLLDMILYLFNNRLDHTFEMTDRLGFPGVFAETFGCREHSDNKEVYLAELHNIFRSNGLSYRFCKDILERQPTAVAGWEEWRPHHLTLMGGMLWTIIAGTSLLGMLKWEAEYAETAPMGSIISYPEGVANYLAADINIAGIKKH